MTEFVIVLIVIAILVALGFGLIGMVRGGKKGSDKMFKSLVTRVSLSVLLFILVLFSGYMGWIEPNMIMVDAPIAQK
ncbi:twin transmembrane helix small protein [Candidatus Thioglobus sp.]|nr:twin transmembrane helix small protein [Candidatus Thioglobus sp.]MDC0390848.1 twin transmembrane helix small protein [Candidatus Thioglobus sp.]MDC0407522.1 twin transmembrane helix small protein [Candidatus Thioglobus sp.]